MVFSISFTRAAVAVPTQRAFPWTNNRVVDSTSTWTHYTRIFVRMAARRTLHAPSSFIECNRFLYFHFHWALDDVKTAPFDFLRTMCCGLFRLFSFNSRLRVVSAPSSMWLIFPLENCHGDAFIATTSEWRTFFLRSNLFALQLFGSQNWKITNASYSLISTISIQ